MNAINDFKNSVIINDLKSLKEIVKKENINLTIENNYALRWATKYNHHDMVLFLLDNINDIDYSIKKYILFKSAENNNFDLFKIIYNSHDFCLLKEEYNNNNILLTYINCKKNINKEFVSFIFNEIGDKITPNYLRDSYYIAFENCDFELLDVFFEYKIHEIIKSRISIEEFFNNDIAIYNPNISISFIKIIEKHFDLEKSHIRYYTLIINCLENNIIEGALYLIKKYNINKIPKSSLSVLIQSILSTENVHLIEYFKDFDILKSQKFIQDICEDLFLQSSIDGILYIIENLNLEEDTKIKILKQCLKYKSIDTVSLIIPNINIDLSFDNLFLIRKIFEEWNPISEFNKCFLHYLLNDDNVYSKINTQWIEDNIPKDKIEIILIEYKVRKF